MKPLNALVRRCFKQALKNEHTQMPQTVGYVINDIRHLQDEVMEVEREFLAQRRPELITEFADVIIMACSMIGAYQSLGGTFDLDAAVERKIAINARRSSRDGV